MITRGHYIGEIIDEFAAIAEQVRLRNRLGASDLSVYAENYFRDALNILRKANLQNLNDDRSNEPGLDLGDEAKKLAFQITATATSEKVNKTLKAITVKQAEKYTKFVMLIIGRRQSSYTINAALSAKYAFTTKNIWDMDSLARKAMSLEIGDLQALYRMVRQNSARLRVDLEIPDEDGKYPTSGFDKWEVRVAPKVGSGASFLEFYESKFGEELEEKDRAKLLKAIERLAKDLSILPRITREFLAMLLERQESGDSKRAPHTVNAHLLLPKIEREYQGSDLQGELAILEHAGFISIDGDEPYDYGPPEIFVKISRNEDLAGGFREFVEARSLSYRSAIGAVDLSTF
jgi:hypothetical protein